MLISPDGRPLISTTEAHERSGLSRDHIGLLIRRGIVEAMKVGNYWLIFEESFQRYLDSPRRPGPKTHRSSSDSSMPEQNGKKRK